jgi:phospholipase/lecithinase/hemolysin
MIRFIFLLAVLFPTLSPAMSVNNIFVFGDSLSDGGNVYNTVAAASSGTIQFPPPPYAQRFSNGPVAVEQLASMVGINLQPSTVGGTNFAYGGAATGVVPGTSIDNYLAASIPIPFLNGTGIQNQVSTASGISFDPNHALFVVWGGPNDIFTWLDGITSATIDQVVGSAVSNIMTAIGTLKGYGAENFLIPNMVDLGKTPLGKNLGGTDQAGLSLISSTFNAFLGQGLDAIVGANIFRPDVNNLLQLVQANPLAYGIDNATDACVNLAASTVCQNPDRYLFWDSVHPTQHGHALIAGEFYASAVPEPSVIALISLAILVGFSFRRLFA